MWFSFITIYLFVIDFWIVCLKITFFVFLGKSREICSLKLDVGRCEGHFDSWYYDVARGVCEPFQYSGCGGNANRFNTKELCEGLCLLPVSPDVSVGGAAPGLSSFGPVNPSIGMDGSSGLKSVGVVSSVLSKVNRFFQSAKIDGWLKSSILG